MTTASPVRLPPGQFYGGVTRQLDIDDLLLRETRHAPWQVTPRHEHVAAHFCLAVEGECTERIHRRDIRCCPGTVEYHPTGTLHSSRWEASGGHCFTVTLGAEWSARMVTTDRENVPRSGVLHCAARDLMVRLYRELRAPDACSATVIDGLTLALLGVAGRADVGAHRGTAPAWLARAEEYLKAHAFGRVRAADAATAAGVHPVLLSRWFRRKHGITVGEFVRHLRMARASQLLATTRQPITQVALACGFVDHAHLSRMFQRTMGLTPSTYRRLRFGG